TSAAVRRRLRSPLLREEGPAVSSCGVLMRNSLLGPSFQRLDADPGRLGPAQAQTRVADANLHRVAQRREAEDFHDLVLQQPQLPEPLSQPGVALQRDDARPLALAQLIEGGHERKKPRRAGQFAAAGPSSTGQSRRETAEGRSVRLGEEG